MAVESVLGGMAANMAESAFKQQMQYQYQKNLNRQAQSYYERDLKLSQQLNIDAQRAAIAQSTRALRDAGISPAMASAGGFSAPAASSPLASSAAGISSGSGAEYVGAITQARLGDAQIENLEAQTQKTNAETDAIRNKNPEEVELLRRQQRNLEALTEKYGTEQLLLGKEYERKLSEDDYVTKRLKNYIQFRVHQAESRGDSVERDLWLSLLDETAAGLTLGTLAGMQRFAQYVNDLDEYDKDAVLRQLHRSIARMQLDDDKLLSVIAHMPENDAALKLAQMAEALANRDFRDAYRKELLPVQKSQGEQDIVSSRHKDFVGMAKDGDIGGAAAYLLPDLFHLGGEVLLLRSLRGSGKGSVLPLGKPENPAESFKGSFSGSSAAPKKSEQPVQLKLSRIKKELEKMRQNGDKYFKPKVYQDKLDEYYRVKDGLSK